MNNKPINQINIHQEMRVIKNNSKQSNKQQSSDEMSTQCSVTKQNNQTHNHLIWLHSNNNPLFRHVYSYSLQKEISAVVVTVGFNYNIVINTCTFI